MLKRFFREEQGSSAAEYALIIAVVGAGIGAASMVLGSNVTFALDDAANKIVDNAEPLETP